jgi:hypothetical protein
MGDNKSMAKTINKLVIISIVDEEFNVHTIQFTNVDAEAVKEAIDHINDEAEDGSWLS